MDDLPQFGQFTQVLTQVLTMAHTLALIPTIDHPEIPAEVLAWISCGSLDTKSSAYQAKRDEIHMIDPNVEL